MKHILIILLLHVTVLNANAQDKHAIDVQLEACLKTKQAQTTIGMINCITKAKDAWDLEMNKQFKTLLSILGPEERDRLKTAQRNWIAYRDSESLFAVNTYYPLQGTVWKITAIQRQLAISKQRALELKEYCEHLNKQ